MGGSEETKITRGIGHLHQRPWPGAKPGKIDQERWQVEKMRICLSFYLSLDDVDTAHPATGKKHQEPTGENKVSQCGNTILKTNPTFFLSF